MLIKTFRPNIEKGIRRSKIPQNDELHKLQLSNVTWGIATSRVRRTEQEENIHEKRNPYRVLVGRSGRRIQLRSRGVLHGSIILKLISRK
jgi:hypothetical protein